MRFILYPILAMYIKKTDEVAHMRGMHLAVLALNFLHKRTAKDEAPGVHAFG